MIQSFSPINESERMDAIDIIRGFAILGIFLVNMGDFHSPWLYVDLGEWRASSVDSVSWMVVDLFAQASFYTLFSFLFGFGMVIFKERSEAKGHSFLPLYSRRLLVLLGFGIIHAFLIWHGDILISYAVVGFLLLLFHKAKPTVLAMTALFMILVPGFLLGSLLVAMDSQSANQSMNIENPLAQQSLEVYGEGTYAEITSQRIQDWTYVNISGGLGPVFLILSLLPMFLLGAYVAQKRWFHDPEQYSRQVKRLWVSTFIIATVFKLLPYWKGDNVGFEYMQDTIGGPASALFYASSIILLTRQPFWKKSLSGLGAVGRMSLSNYLFQSVVSTMIFYSYGLGLYGQFSVFKGILLVAVIFTCQVFISKWWVKKFRFGPVEWLWRTLTYRKRQPFARKAVQSE